MKESNFPVIIIGSIAWFMPFVISGMKGIGFLKI